MLLFHDSISTLCTTTFFAFFGTIFFAAFFAGKSKRPTAEILPARSAGRVQRVTLMAPSRTQSSIFCNELYICHDTSTARYISEITNYFPPYPHSPKILATMDITDILQDLNARHLDRGPFAEGDDDFGLGNGRPSGQADLQALTRAWVNERGATELLPYAIHSHCDHS